MWSKKLYTLFNKRPMIIMMTSWHLEIELLKFAWVRLHGVEMFLDIDVNVDVGEPLDDVEE
jgi:hypothetical protein